jgi:predicted nucleotidyltransferase
MVAISDILGYVDEVARQFRPRQIILFGSYAYGRPDENSDVDLLVVMNYRGDSHEKAVAVRGAATRTFPMDLVIRRPAEIRRRIGWNDFFLKEITERGLVLYAADDRRMGEEGRRRLRHRFRAAAVA